MGESELNRIIQGDTLEVLKTLPAESVDCIITSPPYYGLRDYGTAKWEGGNIDCEHEGVSLGNNRNGLSSGEVSRKANNPSITSGDCIKCGAKRIDRQIGLEKSLAEYLDRMLEITAELKRVLKPTGTLWWNHGDSYGAGARKTGVPDSLRPGTNKGNSKATPENMRAQGYEKSLLLQAHRLIIRMIDEQGWILRNQIIWHKPNVMPSSVKDRFTVDFEPVFFFSKSKKYWFEPQYEPYTEPMNRWGGDNLKAKGESKWDEGTGQESYRDRNMRPNSLGRNKRAVWKIATHPFKEAHFATFPEALIEPMVKAGCPQGGVCLDPFFGAGTTGVVAKKLGRNYLGIELNKSYIEIAEKRIASIQIPMPML